MKHAFRIAVALVVVALPVSARAQGVTAGVRAGVNLANLSFDPEPPDDAPAKNLTGLVAGVFVTIPVTPIFALQPEGLYSMQGTRFTVESTTAKLKVDYFQVPVLARVRLGSGSPVALLAGPSFGIRTHAKFEVPGEPDVIDEFADSINRFDVGLVTGVSVDAGPLVFDGRYTWGLTNIVKDQPVSVGESGSAKHRVLSLTAGLRF